LLRVEGRFRKGVITGGHFMNIDTVASRVVQCVLWCRSLTTMIQDFILDYRRSGISRKGHGRMSGCVSSLSNPLRQLLAWEGISCVTGAGVVYLTSGSEFGALVQLGGKKSVRLSGHTSRYHAVSVGD